MGTFSFWGELSLKLIICWILYIYWTEQLMIDCLKELLTSNVAHLNEIKSFKKCINTNNKIHHQV